MPSAYDQFGRHDQQLVKAGDRLVATAFFHEHAHEQAPQVVGQKQSRAARNAEGRCLLVFGASRLAKPRIVVFEASASNTILPHLHMARKLGTALWKIKLADAVCSE